MGGCRNPVSTSQGKMSFEPLQELPNGDESAELSTSDEGAEHATQRGAPEAQHSAADAVAGACDGVEGHSEEDSAMYARSVVSHYSDMDEGAARDDLAEPARQECAVSSSEMTAAPLSVAAAAITNALQAAAAKALANTQPVAAAASKAPATEAQGILAAAAIAAAAATAATAAAHEAQHPDSQTWSTTAAEMGPQQQDVQAWSAPRAANSPAAQIQLALAAAAAADTVAGPKVASGRSNTSASARSKLLHPAPVQQPLLAPGFGPEHNQQGRRQAHHHQAQQQQWSNLQQQQQHQQQRFSMQQQQHPLQQPMPILSPLCQPMGFPSMVSGSMPGMPLMHSMHMQAPAMGMTLSPMHSPVLSHGVLPASQTPYPSMMMGFVPPQYYPAPASFQGVNIWHIPP